jgi:hypothetical protein
MHGLIPAYRFDIPPELLQKNYYAAADRVSKNKTAVESFNCGL